MKIFCSASSDAYITDKIIDQKFRATDANTGRAGVLDLFKLYDETLLTGSDQQNEISRILVKFDISKPKRMIQNIIDVSDSEFKAEIVMADVGTGNPTPSNFTVIATPLSQAFDEGIGRNLSSFSDLGAVNFFTSSIVNGAAQTWHMSGANKEGFLGAVNIDIIGSGSIGGEVQNYYGTQHFKEGNEDLRIDVTNALSGTLKGDIADLGFRIAFSGSDDTDKKTRFVKRFSSRHSANPVLRPRLEISFNDSVNDNRSDMFFDMTGSLFLRNIKRSSLQNLQKDGSDIQPEGSLKIKLVKGSFFKIFDAYQHRRGSYNAPISGVYTASIAISSDEEEEYAPGKSLKSLIDKEKKVVFEEYWYSADGTKGYHTGSITFEVGNLSANFSENNLSLKATNCRSTYSRFDQDRIRLFGVDHSKKEESRKKPREKKSEIFENVHYRVLDADTLLPVFDFDSDKNSTRVSTDSAGMYFDFHFDILPYGRAYLFEYEVNHAGTKKIIRDKSTRFTVV